LKIKNVEKSSLVDYPPHICATVFIGGCNFRCPWCYNPTLIPKDNKSLSDIPEHELLNWLEKRKGKLDSICLTGGEPTIHGHELTSLIHPIKSMGYKIKLDTNGSNPSLLNFIVKNSMVDYVAMDIKGDFKNYSKYVGIPDFDATPIEQSVMVLKSSDVDHEFRMTVVPSLHDKKTIEKTASQVGKENLILQNFVPAETINPEFSKLNPYEESYIKEIANELNIKVR